MLLRTVLCSNYCNFPLFILTFSGHVIPAETLLSVALDIKDLREKSLILPSSPEIRLTWLDRFLL